MIKLKSLKLMFNDLTMQEKLAFEKWIQEKINSELYYKNKK